MSANVIEKTTADRIEFWLDIKMNEYIPVMMNAQSFVIKQGWDTEEGFGNRVIGLQTLLNHLGDELSYLRGNSMIKASYEAAKDEFGLVDLTPCIPYVGKTQIDGYHNAMGSMRGLFAALKEYDVPGLEEWEFPADSELDHVCHSPATCKGGPSCTHRRCVNIAHVMVTKSIENLKRSNRVKSPENKDKRVYNVNKTTCLHGHEMTPDNRKSNGQCKRCNADYQASYRSRLKEAASTI